MRRQTKPYGFAARWSVRALAIDRRRIPVRYSLRVETCADQGRSALDHVEIRPGIVMVVHELSGLKTVKRAFAWEDLAGVAIRVECLDVKGADFFVSVNLHGADPKLCFPLFQAETMEQVGARWHAWACALKLPLLLPTVDGEWREPIERFRKLTVNPPCGRPTRLGLENRRSSYSSIREVGDRRRVPPVTGRELIARK